MLRGSWVKSRAVLTFESVGVSVATGVASAATVTVVFISPTASSKSMRLIWLASRTIPSRAQRLKPAIVALTP